MDKKDEFWGWRCSCCGLQFKNNPRFCARCRHTVYRPVWLSDVQKTDLEPPTEGTAGAE